ncbi:group I truncated hemoglobin [Salinispora vitiensis]|uniref:group I truncated hemoglobin n=1 Tax=Salinispora vitiensis TaxID=999544 RepID=UPI001CC532C9|nr:group 1 truncated hemoglobin [Salinispora vitiensis]
MTTTTQPEKTESMYDRIGGASTVTRVVDRLYTLILDDSLLRPTFHDTDLAPLKRHMAALLSQVLDGPKAYTGRDLATVHKPVAITDAQYRSVADYLLACLYIEHAPADVLAAVAETLTALQATVVSADSDPAAAGVST